MDNNIPVVAYHPPSKYGTKGKNLEETPSYRIAVVVFVFIAASLLIEHSFHHLIHYLEHQRKKGLHQAVVKVKDELMLLGLLSLILSVFSTYFASVCIKSEDDFAWYPCAEKEIDTLRKYREKTWFEKTVLPNEPDADKKESIEKFYVDPKKGLGGCKDPGYEPWITFDAANYLHYLLFVLASVLIVYASFSFLLAFVRVRRWRISELKTHEDAPKLEGMTNDERLRFAGLQDSPSLLYGVGQAGGNIFSRVIFWISCFFQMPFRSIGKRDYITLRMLFLIKHDLPMNFDFHWYIMRCMEEDFSELVGVPWPFWVFLCLLLLGDVSSANLFWWCQVVAFVLILIVATKCLAIVRTLSREATKGTGHFVATDPRPTDELFWFKKPRFLLGCIHFVVFVNSLDLAAILFHRWKFYDVHCLDLVFGMNLLGYRIALSVLTLFFSAFVALPIYAIAAQMGSEARLRVHGVDAGSGKHGHHDDHGHATHA
ncbi:hypothetical protein CBR_g40665 [Chara braunii]|uniref:MLO-like protein n=1 Tax=Chara braunii TaxID=69332 RepID=A0A388LU49_CHABU|nr:hypothetical protein CBR_g40665 [Chara braunii]|eukprot:GBG85854.1 hypothetical protein CBR_g40665 [Chara braunii]